MTNARKKGKQNESEDDESLAFVIGTGTISATNGKLGEPIKTTQIGFIRPKKNKKSNEKRTTAAHRGKNSK
jgi:hypothetical protein